MNYEPHNKGYSSVDSTHSPNNSLINTIKLRNMSLSITVEEFPDTHSYIYWLLQSACVALCVLFLEFTRGRTNAIFYSCEIKRHVKFRHVFQVLSAEPRKPCVTPLNMDSTESPPSLSTLHLASSPTPGKTLRCPPPLTNHYSPVCAGNTHYCLATGIEVRKLGL